MEIPAAEVAKEYEVSLQHFRQSAKVKGFRAGMAPENVVRQMYDADIKESVLNSLAPRAVGRELAAHKLNPVNTPVITDIAMEEGKPLHIKAEFEVWPDFQLPKYKGLKVKTKKKTVTPKDVDESLEDLRERSAQYVPVEDRSVRQDDYVMAHIQGKDTKTRRLLPSEKVFVLTGHPDNEEALNENIMGMRIEQEKDFKVRYPEDHQNKRVAGKEIEYHLKVVSIKEKKLPDLDDSFAKDMGKFENLKELKAEIRTQLEQSGEQQSQRALSEEIVRMVADKAEMELPDSLVRQETLTQLQRIVQSQGQAATKQEDPAKLEEEARLKAAQTVKNHLILMRIAQNEKLEVTEEEMTEEFKVLAEANRVPLAQVVDAMNRDDRKLEMKQNLLLRKTIDYLVEHAIME
jgi:trigger factor